MDPADIYLPGGRYYNEDSDIGIGTEVAVAAVAAAVGMGVAAGVSHALPAVTGYLSQHGVKIATPAATSR
ncbi:hypothetical protein ACWGB8_31340 [Kitasatospora sp. NPDC054939]